jgi:hypothetical protein
MRIYYLEAPLSDEDVYFVQEELEIEGEAQQVRVPFVLPVHTELFTQQAHERHERQLVRYLRKVGIEQDGGKQVVLVAPNDMYWHSVLIAAVYKVTGIYPYLVQTEAQRASIDNPGPTRLLDMHGLMDGM